MTLKRERECVPAFLFYMEGSEIMAKKSNIKEGIMFGGTILSYEEFKEVFIEALGNDDYKEQIILSLNRIKEK